MPHPLQLPASLQPLLFAPNMPRVVTRVYFEGRAKTQTNAQTAAFPTFSAGYSVVTWEITPWLKARPVVTFSKPIIPDGKYNNRISAGTLSLTFANHDTRLAAIGAGAILDPVNIDSGEIAVRVQVGGAVDMVDLFRGRITAQPAEKYGETEISLRDSLWDVLKTEMPYELYNNLGGGVAVMATIGGQFSYQAHQTNAGYETHASYASFIEDGSLFAAVNVSGSGVDLSYLNILADAPLGEYTLRFQSPTAYTLSVPDGQSFHGITRTTLITPYVVIPPGAITGQASNGAEITVQTGNAVRGNPAAIAANMVEKGLLRNFGEDPGVNPARANLPVVWSSFDTLRQRFWGWDLSTVFTNKDNGVFERKGGNRPLSFLEAAQFCADHLGANILRDGQGQIYIQGPYIDNDFVYTLDGFTGIISHSIESVRKYNYLTVQYGRNDYKGNVGSTIEIDLRSDPTTEVEEIVIGLPGFKIGDHVHEVQVASTIYRERALNSAVRVQIEVTPQFGMTIAPGDRYYLDLQKQPAISGYFEVYRVRTQPGETATVNLHQVPAPGGEVFRFGAFAFGTSQLG
jgi:hypothetical protein